MAINGRFRASMEDVFPAGAFVVAEVEAVRDFDRFTPERSAQARDRETGELLWSMPVLDADESVPKEAKTVLVKISTRAMRASGAGVKASGGPVGKAA